MKFLLLIGRSYFRLLTYNTLLIHCPIAGVFVISSILQLEVVCIYCAFNYMVPALFPLKFYVEGEGPIVI